MRPPRRSAVLVLLLSLSAAGASPELTRAKALFGDLKYKEAGQALEAAWKVPGNSRAELLSILQLQGVVAGSLNQPAQAKKAFLALLVIDPGFKLADDLPPRVLTPFFEARGQLAELGHLELSPQPATRTGGRVTQLTVEVTDPLKQVAHLVFHLRGVDGTWTELRVERGGAPADAESLDWWVEARNEFDGVLATAGSEAEPKLERPAARPSAPVEAVTVVGPSSSPLRPVAWICLGVGAASLIAGGAMSLRASGLQGQINGAATDASGHITGLTQKDAYALESQLRTSATVADALYVAGGVAAAAGAVFFLVSGPSSPQVALSPAGPGVALSGSF